MKKIYAWEPYFFIFFGLFHLHRIWALVDRKSYASFWIGILENKSFPYFLIIGILALLCILGIVTFFRECKYNYWWRWIYMFGGCYALFDLFAIATGIKFWHQLLLWMFDANSPWWNVTWMFFILLGAFVAVLGIYLLVKHKKTMVLFILFLLFVSCRSIWSGISEEINAITQENTLNSTLSTVAL
ncbi:MAG TPA: hypothetical protein PK385_01430 [Spirochaetota bacterium]|nr:hypothetical protein [Spirochaetota bacterium]HOS32288.1 hypothetical protein [Spirochaetota bacterium]HOS54698.1 hypothetical protein [Spirochaetota bacterium]HQF77282.1 hypothetical protein [Spirochaetota bacterium]HQH29358.1 hypothetical protein [Spirochaetota bacterium]